MNAYADLIDIEIDRMKRNLIIKPKNISNQSYTPTHDTLVTKLITIEQNYLDKIYKMEEIIDKLITKLDKK